MAIVIKEIILSDTIEKFMEKVNFNFDQLMLAGGGPQGPQGNIGPIGPIGPEGDPGNKWYVGCTGTTSAIGASLFMGDLFLQKGNCIGATYPLGEVLEFNEITQIFVPTGLNLRGPTGATGSTGTSTGWGVYPGIDTGSVYNGTNIEDTPGPTASFVLLKGDTIGVTGDAEHPEYSKDTLYLGGLRGMSNQAGVYAKTRLPKLFVSPKTIISADEFTSNTGSTGAGLAGSGIALIREPLKSGLAYTPINQYSYSNIFIDDKMNLNISNFSDYSGAVTLDSGVTNDIKLMSKIGVKLIGGHYQALSANGLLEVSQALSTPLYPDTSGLFPAGGPGFHLRSAGNLNTGTISLEGTNQLRIISERASANTNLVDVAYWANVTLLSPNNKYRIGIGANAKYKDVTAQISDMPFIGSGTFDDSATEYIGLGNKPTGNKAPTLSTFTTAGKDFVLIGDPNNYDPPTDLGSLVNKSIDIEGQIRMRYGASSPGQVLITTDSIGTAEWSAATSLGGWKNDSACDTKIHISLNDERFASFVPGSGINYTRVDIPSLNDNGETDVYFGDYSMTSGNELTRQGHIINKRYKDQEGNGVLAISTGLLKNCPVNITGREMQGTSTVSPRIQVGAYGEIVIGYLAAGNGTNLSELGVINDVANNGVNNDLKTGLLTDSLKIYKSQTSTQNGSILHTQKVNRANIHLINTNYGGSPTKFGDYINPKIKFTPDDSVEDGTIDGFVSTTSIEILRTHGSNTGSEGPANIRFLGVGKSPKAATTGSPIPNTIPSNTTTGRGEDIPVGAHVMMISDVDAQNKYGETGKAYDYYELVDSDLYVETLSATFLNQTAKAAPIIVPQYQYKEYEFAPWGTSESGWNNITGANAYKVFYGSRTIDENIDGITDIPNDYNLDSNTFTWDPASTPKTLHLPGGVGDANNASFLNTWISPTTGVRFSPMNLSVPNGNTQTGLAWVDFNIDMGLIFEAATDHFSGWGWNDDYLGIANSLGTNARSYDPASPLANLKYTPAGDIAGAFKVKHIKVRLDNDKLGITSFLDNLDYSRRRSPLDPTGGILQDNPSNTNNSAVAKTGIYYTDWYVGQVKPMNNLRGLGKTGNAPFGEVGSQTNLHIDSSASLSWSYMSDTSGRIYPWANDPSNAIASQYPDMVWNQLDGEVPIYANRYANFANNNKYTNFMWRIYTIYEGGIDTPKGCYLEIYCTPDAHRAWYEDQSSYGGNLHLANKGTGNAYLNIDRTEGSYGYMPAILRDDLPAYGMQQQRGGFYPNVITMFDEYRNTSGVVKLDLEALLTNAKRTHNFYETHGFSLSGQATVKWNRAQNEW